MSDGLLSATEVGMMLGINAVAARQALHRAGIVEVRGYPEDLVLELAQRRTSKVAPHRDETTSAGS